MAKGGGGGGVGRVSQKIMIEKYQDIKGMALLESPGLRAT